MTQYLLSSDSKTLTHTLTNGLTNHAEYHLFDLNVVIGHQEKMHQSQRNFSKELITKRSQSILKNICR